MGGNVRARMKPATDRLDALYALWHNPPLPPRADGQLKMPEEWVTPGKRKARRLQQNNAASTFSIPANTGITTPGIWVAQQDLVGGLSNAWLWVRVNGLGTIMDRVVRKDTYMRSNEWYDVRRWQGDPTDENFRDPLEIRIHEDLSGINGANVVQLKEPYNQNLHVWNADMMYRMLIAWCPYGDLHSLIAEYRNRQEPIPEPAIWYIFECLAEAGMAMESGHVSPDDVPNHWIEVIHRDLKPANVFLDARDPNRYPDYPRAVLGDFGLAFRDPEEHPTYNPRWYNEGVGTRGFLAPEQRRYVNQTNLLPIDNGRLNAKTNVWGIGQIIYCLVTLKWNPDQPNWLGDGFDEGSPPVDATDGPFVMGYSNTLLNLIRNCLSFQPWNRPTFAGLHNSIFMATRVGAGAGPLSQGMHDASATLATMHNVRLRHGVDRYMVGLARNVARAGSL